VGCWKRGYYYSRGRYAGNGDLGRLEEIFDADERELAQQERKLVQADRQAFQEARQQAQRIDALVKAGLEAEGYHRARRHQWRWRRETMGTQVQPQAAATATYELSKLVQTSYLSAMAGKNRKTFDGLEAKLQALRTRLAGPDPSPALELATEAAVFAWLDH